MPQYLTKIFQTHRHLFFNVILRSVMINITKYPKTTVQKVGMCS